MKSFFRQIKHILSDIRIPFNNFIHWNITKIINALMGYFLWIVFSAPIIVICIFYIIFVFPEVHFSDIFMKALSMTLSPADFAWIFDKNGLTTILSLLIFIAFLLFTFWKTYTYVLNLFMYKNYFNGEKIGYKKNIFLHIPTLKKYAQIFLWNSLFLSLPLVLFLIIFGVFIFIVGWLEWALSVVLGANSWFSWFSILLLIALIWCIASFAYINFRIIFSVLFFVESDEFFHHQKTKALDWIKKSLKSTSGIKKIFLFILIFVLFGIITLPFTYKNDLVENNIKNGTRYVQLVQIASMSGVTLPQAELDELGDLSEEFAWKTGQEIIDFIDSNSVQKIILALFYFFIISGITELLMYSYFYHVLLQKNKTHD
jgi:hypothetical protein